MAEADIGKIVSLIMENPDIVEKIKSIAKENNVISEEAPPQTKEDEKEAKEAVAAMAHEADSMRSKRRELLCALRPYVSEKRSKAIDSMMNIADILDMMKWR